MRTVICQLAAAAAVCQALFGGAALAQSPPEMSLTRFDCGTPAAPILVSQRFSDTYAFGDLRLQFVFSCYLIRHGDQYLIWDTGHSMSAGAVAPKRSLVDQLAQLNLQPDQITHVGISHYHPDHTGQAGSFPKATLLIGRADWEVVTAAKPIPAVNPSHFAHWVSGGGKLETLPQDKDVFGDGRVIILNTPGHTPGHHSLLVRLPQTGDVLITGDLAHFRENYETNGVPSFNTDRADTLASLDRFKKIEANLKALVVMQHDARDVAKLPAFPASAK